MPTTTQEVPTTTEGSRQREQFLVSGFFRDLEEAGIHDGDLIEVLRNGSMEVQVLFLDGPPRPNKWVLEEILLDAVEHVCLLPL